MTRVPALQHRECSNLHGSFLQSLYALLGLYKAIDVQISAAYFNASSVSIELDIEGFLLSASPSAPSATYYPLYISKLPPTSDQPVLTHFIREQVYRRGVLGRFVCLEEPIIRNF